MNNLAKDPAHVALQLNHRVFPTTAAFLGDRTKRCSVAPVKKGEVGGTGHPEQAPDASLADPPQTGAARAAPAGSARYRPWFGPIEKPV